jgi:biopolymer transport protein ExbB
MKRGVPFLTMLLLTIALSGRSTDTTTGFDLAAESVRTDLHASQTELTELNRTIAREKLPLARQVSTQEARTAARRDELQSAQSQAKEAREIVAGLESETGTADQEIGFLVSALAEFGHFLETKVHISELRRHGELIEAAEAAADDVNLTDRQRLELQFELLERATVRVEELLGGQTFAGSALSPDGQLLPGRFVLAGPVAVFAAEQGEAVGIAQLEVNSLDPIIVPLTGSSSNQVRTLAADGKGLFPVDPSGGRALQLEGQRETLGEHLWKGGAVMIPILTLAVLAGLLAIVKWIQISRLRTAHPADVELILKQLAAKHKDKAIAHARALRGPAGTLLETAIENADQKKELLEEMLYEQVLHMRPRLERWLPFIGLTAAVAPLLGLLGTVTGMINTFKLITLFGTGDAKTLSSGISEALITTECGLIVAVSALLIHAVLTRSIRGFITSLEQAAVGFVNGLALRRDDQ